MRRLRYQAAASLDGFIAGPKGEYDWIVSDPTVDADLGALFAEFDHFLMGRLTYETALSQGPANPLAGMNVTVVSRTLRPEEHPGVTIVSENLPEAVAALKAAPGKDIWLFGGGSLFRALLDYRLVDTIEVGLMPILLGEGVPLLPTGGRSPALRLVSHKPYPSGIVMLSYEIAHPA